MNNDLYIQGPEQIIDRNKITGFAVGSNLAGKSIVIGVDKISFMPRTTEMEITLEGDRLTKMLEETDEILINGFHFYKLAKDTR